VDPLAGADVDRGEKPRPDPAPVSAIAPAKHVYQVSVPNPTSMRRAALANEDCEPPETAAGAAAIQSAIVSGLNAIAAKARRGGQKVVSRRVGKYRKLALATFHTYRRGGR
jgi:hypothetical protein